MTKKSTETYKTLIEQNVRSNEQLVQSMKDHSDVLKAITQNLDTLNNNTAKINDSFHNDMEIVKNYYMKNIEEMKTWIKYLVIMLIAAVGGGTLLKLSGII